MYETTKDMTEKTTMEDDEEDTTEKTMEDARTGSTTRKCETPEEDTAEKCVTDAWNGIIPRVLLHIDHNSWANARFYTMHYLVVYRIYALLCCISYTLLELFALE